jgi:hypothetical protein
MLVIRFTVLTEIQNPVFALSNKKIRGKPKNFKVTKKTVSAS